MPVDLSRTPALAPPPGVTPNFDDPVTREHQVRAVTIFTIVVAGVFVTLRIYTGAVINRHLRWDDGESITSDLKISANGVPRTRSGSTGPLL